ncbi:hypothetical protein N0V88_002580 [Collariella sp. IMI 366227]|nr:hypothetical protein N0V88_002580 [Collariella sp. IMI 366227]
MKASRLFSWAALSALPMPALCGSMAAWWTDMGASFVMQNSTTGQLTHSMCNSNFTAIYPNDPPLAFDTMYAPKNGTSLAATGWWDGKVVWASIFYQNNNDDIVSAVYMCDTDNGSGLYKRIESTVISDRDGTPPPNPKTGLSVTLLGEHEGYRLFYFDHSGALHHLKYIQDEGWSYAGPVSTNTNRTGMAVHSMFSGVRNVTVVTPRDAQNMEVSRLKVDGTWQITTFPTPLKENNVTSASNKTSFEFASTSTDTKLESYSGNPNALGIAIDKSMARHTFYIGQDRVPHYVSNFVNGNAETEWRNQPGQGVERWPLADNPESDFAIASQLGTSTIRLIYISGGRLVEAKYNDGRWDPATFLETHNTTAAADTGSGGGGLTTGAKIGVGVGVGVGALLIIGAVLAVCIMRRRRRAALAAAAATGNDYGWGGPPDGPDGMVSPGSQYTTMAGHQSHQESSLWSTSPDPNAIYRESQMGQMHLVQMQMNQMTPQMQGNKWDAMDNKGMAYHYGPTTPPPRELETPNLASELPPHQDKNELPTRTHAAELA